MRFSIITVTYNCESSIGHTIESLLAQEFDDYEYIVIDGLSTDRTLQIIEKYRNRIKNFTLISEKDTGIYDAMNKGIRISKGDYIYFLNSGDLFYSEEVLSCVNKITETNKDIYYGSMYRDNAIQKFPEALSDLFLIYEERMICHQAIFAKRDLLSKQLFDKQLRICADREWLIRALKSGASYYYMKNIIVGYYDVSGVSSVYTNFEKDSLIIAKKYAGNKAVLFIKLKRVIGQILGHKRKR